jgi:hypothetical protein
MTIEKNIMTIKINKDMICGRLGIESFGESLLAKLMSRIPEPNECRWIAGGEFGGLSVDYQWTVTSIFSSEMKGSISLGGGGTC